MTKTLEFIFAVLALPVIASAQVQDGYYQIGYAVNLAVGDSLVNISNDGAQGGFFSSKHGAGNLCVNVYAFDPAEEEIACCACLVTPNGLNSLSVRQDLIGNTLTLAVPSSVIIKLLSSAPSADKNGALTLCNAGAAGSPANPLLKGMIAWGATLEPSASPGDFAPVNVPFLNGHLGPSEGSDLPSICNFIQSQGSGYGICNSCRLGALNGDKQ